MNKNKLSRRKFLAQVGALMGGAALACRSTGAAPASTVEVVSNPAPAFSGGPVDLLLTNGRVLTFDQAGSQAEAVAVKDGLITQVGSSAELAALAEDAGQVVDLGGKHLTPGLIDAHNHFQVMGQMLGHYTSFNPPEVTTIEELQARLTEEIARLPAGEWVQGYFWAIDGGLPTRDDLDPVSPDNPVWLFQMGGHYGSANSMALEIAGVGPGVASPEGGLIATDANGVPTGVFYNHRAMDYVRRKAPLPTPEEVYQNIVSTQPMFAAVGVTTYHDNNMRGVDTVQAYFDAAIQSALYLRGAAYYTLEWPGDLDRALNQIEHYADGFMRFAGYKFLLDGQAQMAYCHQPHNGVRWDMPTWEPKNFKNTVRALHDSGLQISVHCAGDATADLALDAFEEAMNANPRPDPRHRLEHLILTTPDTTRRIKDLGVIASVQPQFLRLAGDYYPQLFGEDLADRIIVTREWLDAGVHLALGSDSPTTPWYQPQITLSGAVSRVTTSGTVANPDQCLTPEEAFRAHTMGSAYAAHEEDIKGSVEAGKLADLVVWNHDPLTTPLKEMLVGPVNMTLVGGEVVYSA